MKGRHWKRLVVGWFLVGMLLSTPAAAQYCYYGSCSSGDDDGSGFKPWMLLALMFGQVFYLETMEGCALDHQPNTGSP